MTESTIEQKSNRIANIERLRFLAASAVASFHTHPDIPRDLGHIGFMCLLLSLCVFVVNKSEPYDFADLAKRKALRLLKPWLFWSLIYGGLSLVKVIYMNVPFSEVFPVRTLLTGTRPHLWFLTFAFAAAMFLNVIHQITSKVAYSVKIPIAALIGALCVFGCASVQTHIQLPTSLRQWLVGLPGIPLGFAVGQSLLVKKSRSRCIFFVLVILLTILTFVVLAWIHYDCKIAYRYSISLAMVCSALYWQGKLDPISKKLGALTYGIYLIHPIVGIALFQFGIATKYPWFLLLIVVAVSSVVTFFLQKTPLRQFV